MLDFLKEWFTHSHSERRGIIALLVILVLVIVAPTFFPKPAHEPEDVDRFKHEVDAFYLELEKLAAEDESARTSGRSFTQREFTGRVKPAAFPFDPNTADSALFCALGFSPKQARAIVNYRLRGKKFKSKEDFKKVVVVSKEMYQRLSDYIRFSTLETPAPEAPLDKYATGPSKPRPVHPGYPRVRLNTADTSELKILKSIGSYYAERIAAYRTRLGGYYSIDQLLEIRGIDQERLSQFAEQVEVDTFYIKKLAINTLSEAELRKHPYMDAYTAKGIVSYRGFKGRIGSLHDLLKERILKQDQADRLAPYLEY